MIEAKELKEAFKSKELNQSLLASLDRLRMNGSVNIQQYESLKHGYQQKMIAAVSEIANIKSRLSFKLQTAKQSINSHKTDLENLRTEYRSGNLSVKKYQVQERKLTSQLDNLRDEIRILQKAFIPAGCAGKGGTNSCACIKSITPTSGSFAIGTTCRSSCAYTG